MTVRLMFAIVAGAAFAAGQSAVTELKLRVQPESAKVRPHETAAVQVQVYGTVTDKAGNVRSGRLQRDGWKASVVQPGGGWLTKPFLFQGGQPPTEAFVDQQTSTVGSLLGKGLGQYTVKDTFMYVAPAQPGKYTVVAELAGKRGEAVIEVTPDAPAQRAEEKLNFSAEQKSADPYRRLAEHYAPFIAQETWFQPKSDMIARFDFDGDWKGDNNWDSLETGSSQAYVYYAAMETSTHVYLIYNFFHARDYSDNCVMGSCHENDNEGIVLTVQKDGSDTGRLQVLESLAHNNVYSYTNDPAIRNGVHDIDGPVAFWQGSHPMIFLEAGGHGALAATDRRALFSVQTGEFANTGITYVYKGVAERPKSGSDREVGYELLPIRDHWWAKCRDANWKENTFDEFYEYMPFGNRPRLNNAKISGAFYGRKQASNKARPFWGWFDTRGKKAKVVNNGQWGLDPAYSVSRNLTFPANEPMSLDYTFNPYLEIETEAPKVAMATPSGFVARNFDGAAVAARTQGTSSLAGGSAGLRGLAGAVLGQALANEKSAGTLGSLIQKAGVGSVAQDQLKHVAASAGGTSMAPGEAAPNAAEKAAAPAPAQVAPAAAASTPVQAAAPECRIEAVVKGTGVITLQGDQAQYRLADGTAGDVPQVRCTSPLPKAVVTVAVEKMAGSGEVRLEQDPGFGNAFTAHIGVQPGGTSPEMQTIVVRWK